MAQNVIINGVTYQNVPEVDIPKSGSGTGTLNGTYTARVYGIKLIDLIGG